MTERVTRPVTPFVEVVQGSAAERVELIRQTDAGDLVVDDGRVLLRVGAAEGQRATRILLDPDADVYGYLARTDPAELRPVFEAHLKGPVDGLLSTRLQGLTVVLPWQTGEAIPHWPNVYLALAVDGTAGPTSVPPHVSEVQLLLSDNGCAPESLPDPGVPVVAVLPLRRPESVEALPPLLHGMGTGRLPIREVRLRIDPRFYQLSDRRAPFCSEVLEAIASATGCGTGQLVRELAFRERVLHRGSSRHLRADPYFVTWLFRGHPTRGLVPAASRFPVPDRASRREILKTAPESEHESLVAYLDMLESPENRLAAFAARGLFSVSVHYMPNPDLPLRPQHGGIVRVDGDDFEPLM